MVLLIENNVISFKALFYIIEAICDADNEVVDLETLLYHLVENKDAKATIRQPLTDSTFESNILN